MMKTTTSNGTDTKQVTFFLYSGLCNQIFMIINCLFAAHLVNREIKFGGLLINYRSPIKDYNIYRNVSLLPTVVPFEEAFDIDHLNTEVMPMIKCENVKVLPIMSDGDDTPQNDSQILPYPYKGMSHEELIHYMNSSDEKILYAHGIFDATHDEFSMSGNLHQLAIHNLKPGHLFTNARDNIMTISGLIGASHEVLPFKAVHLRLEDDMMTHLQYHSDASNETSVSFIMIDAYIKVLRKEFSPDDRIFIATGLGKFPNKNNFIIEALKEVFGNIVMVTADVMKSQLGKYYGRETAAMVELLICSEADLFVGTSASTFSQVVGYRVRQSSKVIHINLDDLKHFSNITTILPWNLSSVVHALTSGEVMDHVQRIDQEHLLRLAEKKSFKTAVAKLRQQGYIIKGFYHTSSYKSLWREVITEMLMLMDGRRIDLSKIIDYEDGNSDNVPFDNRIYGRLFDVMDSLHVGFAANINPGNLSSAGASFDEMYSFVIKNVGIRASSKAKISFHMNHSVPRLFNNSGIKNKMRSIAPNNILELEKIYGIDKLSTGEMSTVLEMYNYCKRVTREEKKKVMIFYVHSKGTCCGRSLKPRNPPLWREYMNTFVLEFPSICIHRLLEFGSQKGIDKNTTVLCSKVDESQTMTLKCPNGQVITEIDFASFGSQQPENYSCNDFVVGKCHAATSLAEVKSWCLGKSTCDTSASAKVFGDPCVDTRKYLSVRATCGIPEHVYRTCGPNLRIPKLANPPHYAGNFWWSTCDHVASLVPISRDDMFDAWAAEWFSLSVSTNYNVRGEFAKVYSKSLGNVDFKTAKRSEYLEYVGEELRKWT